MHQMPRRWSLTYTCDEAYVLFEGGDSHLAGKGDPCMRSPLRALPLSRDSRRYGSTKDTLVKERSVLLQFTHRSLLGV